MKLTKFVDQTLAHRRSAVSGEMPIDRKSRTLTSEPSVSGPLPIASEPGLRVFVERGADRGGWFDMGTAQITIGTATTNQLVLRDPCVSRVHCEISWSFGHYVVRDLGSTNGSYVDGARVQETQVSGVAILEIGDTKLTLTPFERPVARARPSLPPGAIMGAMVGQSPHMQRLFASLRNVAPSALTCLILGETGTGKELAARALHDESPRRNKPFIVVDCGAIGAQFIEDKLFGHQRGAFTGAHEAAAGVFEEAKGGTVFLDEIGELPLSLQPKLLGLLERREATRIGSHTPVKLDVRVLAATHRDLSEMVREGTFRQDLLYRLCEFQVRLPALRERAEDIAPIACTILEREGFSHRLSDEALQFLATQTWPGNVRELRNTLRRAAVLATGGVIDRTLLDDLEPVTSVSFCMPVNLPSIAPLASVDADSDERVFELSFEAATESVRSEYVRRLRQRFGNDLQRAAAHAGMHPKSVSRLFRMYGVD